MLSIPKAVFCTHLVALNNVGTFKVPTSSPWISVPSGSRFGVISVTIIGVFTDCLIWANHISVYQLDVFICVVAISSSNNNNNNNFYYYYYYYISLSPLLRVAIHIFLRQTMSLGDTLWKVVCGNIVNNCMCRSCAMVHSTWHTASTYRSAR